MCPATRSAFAVIVRLGFTPRLAEITDPSHQELYRVGTVVRVLQLFRLPDGTLRVLVEGLCRVRVDRFSPYFEQAEAFGFQGTPAFIFNTFRFSGMLDADGFKAAFKDARAANKVKK